MPVCGVYGRGAPMKRRSRISALSSVLLVSCWSNADSFCVRSSSPALRRTTLATLSVSQIQSGSTHKQNKNFHMPIEKRIASAGRQGRTKEALDLFDRIESPTIRQVNAAIDACARARPVRLETAFEIIDGCDSENIAANPNVYTYGTLMNAVSRAADIRKAVELLDIMQSRHNVKPNAVVYQSAVTAAANANSPEIALDLLRRAKDANVQLTVVGYNAALSSLKTDWEKAVDLLEKMLSEDSTIPYPDTISYGTVMAACEQCGQWKKVLYFADTMEERNLALDGMAISSALHACQQLGLAEKAIEYLNIFKVVQQQHRHTQGLQRVDIRQPLRGPDAVAYRLAISACARGKAWQEGIRVLDEYCELTGGDVMSYTAAINGCESAGEWNRAFGLLRRMRATGVEPNEVTFAAVIGACATACAKMKNRYVGQAMPEPLQKSLKLLNAIRKDSSVSIKPNIQVYNTAIRVCAEGLDLDRAFELVTLLKKDGLETNIITYGTLMTACERVGSVAGLGTVFNMMRRDEIVPNEIVYGAALSCCRKAGEPERAFLLLRKMIRDGLQPNGATFNTVLVAQVERKSSNAKDMERAILTFQSANSAGALNRQSYALLIRGLTANQRPSDAEALLLRMKTTDMIPDVELYTSTVSAYERIGQPMNALRLMEYMREDGYEFYEAAVLNSAFKRAVRLANVVGKRLTSDNELDGELNVDKMLAHRDDASE